MDALSTDTDVLVWCWPIDLLPEPLARLAALLSADERARAERFIVAQARQRFIAARGGLRLRLGHYLGCDPAALVFRTGPWGKPELLLAPDDAGVRFNLSHSGSHALLAVSRGFEIGADLEEVRPIDEGLADRFFAPEEAAGLRALPVSERRHGFFRLWTRKEAVLKALGTGLTTPLDSFAVSLDAPPRLLRLDGDPQAAAQWRIVDFEPSPGVLVAIAAPQGGWSLRFAEAFAGDGEPRE